MNDSAKEAKNIEMMVKFSPIKNSLHGLLFYRLLLPSFVTTNTIFGLELSGKKSFSDFKSLVVNIFLQCHYAWDLFYRELEVIDCGNVEFECFNFKIQKPKVVRGSRKLTTYWNSKTMQGSFTWHQNVALCNHLLNWTSERPYYGNFLASLRTPNSFHCLNQETFCSLLIEEYSSILSSGLLS